MRDIDKKHITQAAYHILYLYELEKTKTNRFRCKIRYLRLLVPLFFVLGVILVLIPVVFVFQYPILITVLFALLSIFIFLSFRAFKANKEHTNVLNLSIEKWEQELKNLNN